jgi:hypothetical protein
MGLVGTAGQEESVVCTYFNTDTDTASAENQGTYNRVGTTVTVTMTAHGLVTGNLTTLDFTTGTATDGEYEITVTGVDTFTVIDSASGATSGAVNRSNITGWDCWSAGVRDFRG